MILFWEGSPNVTPNGLHSSSINCEVELEFSQDCCNKRWTEMQMLRLLGIYFYFSEIFIRLIPKSEKGNIGSLQPYEHNTFDWRWNKAISMSILLCTTCPSPSISSPEDPWRLHEWQGTVQGSIQPSGTGGFTCSSSLGWQRILDSFFPGRGGGVKMVNLLG